MLTVKLDRAYSLQELKDIPSTTLAFVGDAYFSLLVRTMVLSSSKAKSHKLHILATQYVNAEAQSMILQQIQDKLTTDEAMVVRRARNAPSNTKSKHYGLAEYKKATALEALIGYLYLSNNCERIDELLSGVIENNK